MKKFKLGSRILSCVLVFAMILGTCTTAFAAIGDVFVEDTINYVSLGASNVNGYGLDGYLPDDVTVENKNTANVFGYQRCPEGSYVDLVRDELETRGYSVEVDQLAMSSMRVEELRVLLDQNYSGDRYTEWRFTGGANWFNNAGGLDTLRAQYKTAIEEADLITIDIGVNNFGVYLSNQISSGGTKYDDDLSLIDPELAEKYSEAKAYVYDLIAENAGEYAAVVADLDFAVDAMAYALAGFCANFDIVMDKIYELNPDVTVVAVSIQNLMEGLEATFPGVDVVLPFGDLFGALVDAANLYIAAGSPYSDNYLFADVSKTGRVEFFLDQLLSYDGNPASLDKDMKDCFDVYDDDLFVSTRVDLIAVDYITNQLAPHAATLAGIYSEVNQTALLNAIFADAESNFDFAANVNAEAANLLRGLFAQVATLKPVVLAVAYDVVAEIMQLGARNNVLDLGVVMGGNYGDVEDGLLEAIGTEVFDAIDEVMADPSYTYSINEDFFVNIASAAGVPETLVNTVATLGIRTGIGNSFYGHPNRAGHAEIKAAVIDALDNDVCGDDVLEDKLDKELENVKNLIIEYYDEAYAYAYAKADEKGYIDAAADAVDKAIKVIMALDVDGIEMTEEFKANLEEELVSIVLTLEEIKTVLKEDKASDVDGLVQSVSALWDDLNAHLAGASALLDQAELDIKTLVVPVVDAYVSALISDLKDTTETELAKAVHKHYEADEDSYYVAIGGNTVLAQGTSESYRKMIGEEYEITSKAVAKKGLYPSDILGFVADNQEEIAKADLITYQMDASSIVYATMFDTPDWDKYLDAETKALTDEILTQTKEILTTNRTEYANAKIGEIIPKVKEAVLAELPEEIPFAEEIFDAAIEFAVPYLQKAIDKAEEKRNEIGSKIEAIDEMAWDYAEKLAYAVVAFAVDTKAAIEEIQAINPGATLVVAGMYNPFNGFEIVVDGERVDIGEIFEYVIDAGNLYYTALAVENDNFAFVDISDAATNGFEDSISIETFDITEIIDEVKGTIFNAADSMHANADGHEYIKDQIVKALTCDYSVYEKLDKTYHTVKCSICDDAKKEKHSFSGKTCTLCGYVKESTGTGTVGGSGGGVVSNQFTVKFVTNGGSAVASVTVKKGELLAEPAAPTKEGFVFDGWYTDKALTAKYDFSTPVTKSFTLYANWAKEDALAKFNDIDKAAWYYEYVKTIVEKGLMNGVSETEFAPNATLTRGMFVTILHRVEGEAAAEGGVDFADVAADQYYANAVKWASVNGIVKGITETEFAPNAEVTREQMAAMIARYVEYKKIEVAVEGDVTYTDSEMISEYAKDAVKTANELGILIGNADGSFAPKKNATRAEAAALFVRLLGVLEK